MFVFSYTVKPWKTEIENVIKNDDYAHVTDKCSMLALQNAPMGRSATLACCILCLTVKNISKLSFLKVRFSGVSLL